MGIWWFDTGRARLGIAADDDTTPRAVGGLAFACSDKSFKRVGHLALTMSVLNWIQAKLNLPQRIPEWMKTKLPTVPFCLHMFHVLRVGQVDV